MGLQLWSSLGPLHTQDWEPVTITLQALSLVEKGGAGPSSSFTPCLRDQWCMWMEGGCKVYLDSYKAPNRSWFMITWTVFENPPLGGSSNTNRETMALRMLTTVGLSYFYHMWGPTRINIHWNCIRLRAGSHMTSHYTRGSVTTLHDFGGVLGRPLDTFFWALTISWSRLLARVWRGPSLLIPSAAWLSADSGTGLQVTPNVVCWKLGTVD